MEPSSRPGPTEPGEGDSRMPAAKNVGEPCAGEPHARFDAAAGGIWCSVCYVRASGWRLPPTLQRSPGGVGTAEPAVRVDGPFAASRRVTAESLLQPRSRDASFRREAIMAGTPSTRQYSGSCAHDADRLSRGQRRVSAPRLGKALVMTEQEAGNADVAGAPPTSPMRSHRCLGGSDASCSVDERS